MANNPFDKWLANLDKIQKELAKDAVPELGMQMADEIKKRTRLGYGVSKNNGSKERLESLSEQYKRARSRMDLSGETSPNKSNLTQTGSMLDSLEPVRTGEYSIQVTPTGNDSNGISNADKASWLTEQGRPFMFLSKPEIIRLKNTLSNHLDTIIKKLF